MNSFLVILIAFAMCLLILLVLLRSDLVKIAMDVPNHRSLHAKSIPRTGGVAVMLAVFSTWLTSGIMDAWLLLPLGLTFISLLDDIFHMPVLIRFVMQVIFSVIFVWLTVGISAWGLVALMAFGLVWMTNLYNFMDGSDGLAGGMTVFGFSAYAVAFYLASDAQMVIMCAAIAGAALAFLCFNFHPAKIFMGDVGSIPLGFLAGAMGIYGWAHQYWDLWFPVLVFSPFVVDATVTLLKRLFRGEKVWQAHREHYYQRLVQMGWGHRKTALAAYCLMALVGVTALLLIGMPWGIVLSALVIWAMVFLALMRLADECWKSMGKSKTIV